MIYEVILRRESEALVLVDTEKWAAELGPDPDKNAIGDAAWELVDHLDWEILDDYVDTVTPL